MNIEEMQKEENFEHEVLDRLKCLDPSDFDYNAVDGSYVDAVLKARDVILTAYEKEKEKNNNAKWYIHQEVVRIKENIEDYIDDDKEGNKHIIGEFKEDLKQWQDVEKLLDGKSKDELYIDWRKYGEYE